MLQVPAVKESSQFLLRNSSQYCLCHFVYYSTILFPIVLSTVNRVYSIHLHLLRHVSITKFCEKVVIELQHSQLSVLQDKEA